MSRRPSVFVAGLLAVSYAYVATESGFCETYLTIAEAQKVMFPEASIFRDSSEFLTESQRDRIRELADVKVHDENFRVWVAEANGTPLGYFIVDRVIGKHEYITYAVALCRDFSIRSVEVMEYNENFGEEIREASWRSQFRGKKQGDALMLEEDIRNISGATLSCRHVTEGIRRILATMSILEPGTGSPLT